jgi:surface carbohydrate biosynthesis protein (TIGR04326 family)
MVRLSTPKTVKRLLVVGDYLGINTHKQLHLLERAAHLLRKGTKITIKPHPNCPVNPALNPQLKMNVELRQLSELMEEHDLVYSSAVTSAAVDAYCAGLPVVSLLEGGNLNLSPLRNCDGVTFVSNPEDLANLVNHDHIEDSGKVQGEDYFYFDLKLPRWRKLLLDNTNA